MRKARQVPEWHSLPAWETAVTAICVDSVNVSEPLITKQGTNQIVIELPAVHDAAQAAQIIGKTAQLQLFDLTPSLVSVSIDGAGDPVPNTSLFDLLAFPATTHANDAN